MDLRVGGKYRLEFEPDAMAFFGTYLEVTPHSRLVWTNEEGSEGGPVTTVTFEEKRGKTLLVMHELYSSKEALDAAGTGAADAMVETFAQLDELLLTLGASRGPISGEFTSAPTGTNQYVGTTNRLNTTNDSVATTAANTSKPPFSGHST